MPAHNDAKEKLIGFICRNFLVEQNEFSPDESLVDQGVIDSFGLVEISSYMEREFGILIFENEMNRDNFGSINKMAIFIERKRK